MMVICRGGVRNIDSRRILVCERFQSWKIALKGHGFSRAESDFQTRPLAPGFSEDPAKLREPRRERNKYDDLSITRRNP